MIPAAKTPTMPYSNGIRRLKLAWLTAKRGSFLLLGKRVEERVITLVRCSSCLDFHEAIVADWDGGPASEQHLHCPITRASISPGPQDWLRVTETEFLRRFSATRAHT